MRCITRDTRFKQDSHVCHLVAVEFKIEKNYRCCLQNKLAHLAINCSSHDTHIILLSKHEIINMRS
jgi:hypothetical protein